MGGAGEGDITHEGGITVGGGVVEEMEASKEEAGAEVRVEGIIPEEVIRPS
jgi:hypothetical protein